MKTNFLTNLKLGSVELERSFELVDLESHNLDSHLIDTYGFVIKEDSNFELENDWKATDPTSLSIAIQTGIAILQDSNDIPRPVELTRIENITVPSTPGTYTITVKYNPDSTEEGSVDVVNGSPNVAGSGTEFTKIFGPNRRLIVNDTAYEIQSVTDDTNLVLVSNFPDASDENLPFKVGGWFTSYPPAIDDNLIYEHNSLTFTVNDSGTPPGSDEYLIAEVDVESSIISEVRDIRDQNLFKLSSRELITNRNGTYAKTAQEHTQVSGTIIVGDGQTQKTHLNAPPKWKK